MAVDLPPEIQFFHILPWLPVKSILRFMCVSKEWHSFLRSPEFIKMHLHHNHQNHRLLQMTNSPTTQLNFRSINLEAPEDGPTAGCPMPFQAFGHAKTQVLTSFHGLVCVGILDDNYDCSHLILWNPSTDEHKTLFKGRSYKKYCNDITNGAFGLYYSTSDDDYKLLRITEYHEVYIYSLNSDSWRKVKPSLLKYGYNAGEFYDKNSIVLNEKLYFLRTKLTYNGAGRSRSQSILVFDIKTEKFTEIAPPSSIKEKRKPWLAFRVVKGCIYLYVFEGGDPKMMELWRMDGDGNGKWTKMGSCYNPEPNTVPIHLMNNGDWVLQADRSFCLHRLDSKTGVSNLGCHYATSGFNLFRFRVDKFIETLVSPNQKRKRKR